MDGLGWLLLATVLFVHMTSNTVFGAEYHERCNDIFPPGSVGICVDACSMNVGCQSGYICCPNGCGRQCVHPYNPMCETVDLDITPPSTCDKLGAPIENACDIDSDCDAMEYCCQYKCGRACVTPGSDCPGGVELNCFANACDTSTCPTHADAECRTTCNGCVAHYFDKFGNEITDECECPQDVAISTSCTCEGKVCEKYPNAECRINQCGTCTIAFFDHVGNKIDDCTKVLDPKCPKVGPGDIGICIEECTKNDDCEKGEICCSNGCGTVCIDKPKNGINKDLLTFLLVMSFTSRPRTNCPNYCLPCTMASCPTSVYARCRSYCNGCLPRFFDRRNQDITSTCACPLGLQDVGYCSINPCSGRICLNYPYAECRVSRCGGCHAEFFDTRGRRISCVEQTQVVYPGTYVWTHENILRTTIPSR